MDTSTGIILIIAACALVLVIGALRRKAHREQQLIGLVPIERAVRQWVLRHQQTHYLIYLLLRSHLLSSIVPPHSMTGSSTLL